MVTYNVGSPESPGAAGVLYRSLKNSIYSYMVDLDSFNVLDSGEVQVYFWMLLWGNMVVVTRAMLLDPQNSMNLSPLLIFNFPDGGYQWLRFRPPFGALTLHWLHSNSYYDVMSRCPVIHLLQ